MSRNWSAFVRGYSPDVGTKIFLFTSGVLTDGNLGNIWKSEITNDMFVFVATSERRLASGHCVSARLLPGHIRYMIWTITTSTFTEVCLQHRTLLKI